MVEFKFVLIFFVLFQDTRILALPLNDEEPGKKIKDEDVAGIIKDLETLIAAISLEAFIGDTMLYQKIDELNDFTSYKANGTSSKDPSIYERQSNDKDKVSIVLKPSEDKITIRKEKKTFVGLRSSPEKNLYYVFYIYLRDPGPNSDPVYTKKVGGKPRLVEYDSWENREDKLQKVNNGFSWSECSDSIFIPCKTTDSLGIAPPRIDHRKKSNTSEKEENTTKAPPKPQGSFKTEVGYDPDENVDFFWDMEDDIQKARFIGIGVDLLSGGLGSIPGLLTGLFGGVTDGVGGLLAGVLTSAGQLISGIVTAGADVVNGIVNAAGAMVTKALQGIFGSQLTVGVELGTNFVSGMTTTVAQGVNAMVEGGTQAANAGIQAGTVVVKTGAEVAGGVIGAGLNLVVGVFQVGLGLVNNLLSFGGLGGPKANKNDVGLAVGINLLGGGQFGTNDAEVEQGLKRPQSGGMGGLLSLDISLELLGNYTTPTPKRKRDTGIMWKRDTASVTKTNKTGNNSVQEIDEKTANDLAVKLAEILARKMGENFGKKILKTGLIEHPGWKTMDEVGAVGNTLAYEDDAFVGFGACEYQKITKKDFEAVETTNDLIRLLTKALRTNCILKEGKMYGDLLFENFLKYNEKEKTFDFPTDNKYLHSEKLNPRRRSDLARAFEMAIFSKVFKAELYNKNPRIAPKNSPVSRRVYVLGQVVIEGIDLVGKNFKCHQVKILRSMLTTLKAAFTKLIQDYEATRNCADCAGELVVIRNDQTYLMTLMEFILHGLAPLQKKSQSVTAALDFFNKTNLNVINNRVEGYLV